jgi:hypothetical protein
MKELVTFEPPYTVVLKLRGEPTSEEIKELLEQTHPIAKGKDKLCLLADLTDLKNLPPKTREAIASGGPFPTYDKLAVVGASARIRMLSALILKLLPVIKKSRFFHTEEEARAWLAKE